VTQPNSTPAIAQDELFGPRDTLEWQIQAVGGSQFRYLPEGDLILVDFDGTGKTLLKVTKHSEDRYFTRLPPDDEDPDGKPIRARGWSNFSELVVALREEWFARARRKEAETLEERAAAQRKEAQVEHDEAVDKVRAAAKSVAEESVQLSKSKVLLIRPALVDQLREFYRQRREKHWRSAETDAVILERLSWSLENPENGKTLSDGHRYIFNTYREWQNHFPMHSISTLKRVFVRLGKHHLVVSKQPEGRRTRRKWYRPTPEGIKLIRSGSEGSKCDVSSDQNDPFPSSESSAENTSDVVAGSPDVAEAPTTTDDLIKEQQKQYPNHDVADEFRRHSAHRRRRGLSPPTVETFKKWMSHAYTPLVQSKEPSGLPLKLATPELDFNESWEIWWKAEKGEEPCPVYAEALKDDQSKFLAEL
jgi:DNA-binding PadR family transcriptional regulator